LIRFPLLTEQAPTEVSIIRCEEADQLLAYFFQFCSRINKCGEGVLQETTSAGVCVSVIIF